jgi:restriction system protein
MAGLVENSRPGYFRATSAGKDVLAAQPDRIDWRFLMRFETFRKAVERSRADTSEQSADDVRREADPDPISAIEQAAPEIGQVLAEELLRRVVDLTPTDFERLIIRLMLAMGYGGSDWEAARHLGRTGDGGIDGVIDGDPLGIDAVYLQAKRYALGETVGRPELQAFVGSLVGQVANKGVFVTTATFSQPARDFVLAVPHRIVLIDGERLAELMIRYGVGIRVRRSIEIKEIDENFFLSDFA